MMELDMMKTPRHLKQSLVLAALMALVAGSLLTGWAANRGNMVIFSASWCASCREVVPIAREIAAQNNLGVEVIDIDAQDAPRRARSFNLQVPADEPPQVFYTDRGRATLLFNGRNYRYGNGAMVRATILQNLQRVQQAAASGS